MEPVTIGKKTALKPSNCKCNLTPDKIITHLQASSLFTQCFRHLKIYKAATYVLLNLHISPTQGEPEQELLIESSFHKVRNIHAMDQSTDPILIQFVPMEADGSYLYIATLKVSNKYFTQSRFLVILYSITYQQVKDIPLHQAMSQLRLQAPPKPQSNTVFTTKIAVIHEDLRLSHPPHSTP
jgi:hypothetical protein